MKKRQRIIAEKAANNSSNCSHKRTHKFGIRLSKTVEEALYIDKEHGNRKWPHMKTHIIFDVKKMSSYASVATRESVHIALPLAALHDLQVTAANIIALTLAALNELQVTAADIQNAKPYGISLEREDLDDIWT